MKLFPERSVTITLVESLNSDLVVLRISRAPFYGQALWSRCVVRKDKDCWYCGLPLKGKAAWRPIGNMGYRMLRICVDCLEKVRSK